MIISATGCYTTRSLTKNDIEYANKSYYYVHGTSINYKLLNAKNVGGILVGTIDYVVHPIDKNKTIQIYVYPDSTIKKTADIVKIPYENINKVEIYKIDSSRTTLLIGGIVVVVGGLIAIPFIMNSMKFHINISH
jgi:sporulation protein YlmC with PRC-barrel domain